MLKVRLAGAAFALLSLLSLTNNAEAKKECPVRQFEGGCIQVITYATNPETGTCCVYPNPCSVPEGWVSSSSGCPS